VSQRFGPFKDKELNIVTTNNGIDISVPVNTSVKAVSGGKVAKIAFMPTFGHIVIIRHPKAYLTVYANLGSIRVAQNELLSSQQVIGVSGKNSDGGSIVHFEIWKGRLKQNPETWLRK
jgi:murein DD-endopeptidase MepM/ murein hydrolase activator NlpD